MDDSALKDIGELFTLIEGFRNAPNDEALVAMLVGRLHRFIPYESAIFWTKGGDVIVASDVLSVPQAQSLAQQFSDSKSDEKEVQTFSLYDEPYTMLDSQAACAVYIPIAYQGRLYGRLILIRTTAWSPAAQIMLKQCGQAAAYSLAAQQAGVHGAGAMRGTYQEWLIAAAFIALFIAGAIVGVFLL